MSAHVPPADPGGGIEQVVGIDRHGRRSLHLYKRIGRMRVVDADDNSRITR
jgi:hypothetical protein